MIGFFDSGVGGLWTMGYFRALYPQYDYLFLGDTKHCPYGERSGEDIRGLTFVGLEWLFGEGCQIVIVACNTAAAYGIRAWQAEFPEKKALSVTVPGVERMIALGKYESMKIGKDQKRFPPSREGQCDGFVVLCTEAMSRSGIYEDLYVKMGGERGDVQCVAAQRLVTWAEKGVTDGQKIKGYVKDLLGKLNNNNGLVLGCTHFPVFRDVFENFWGGKIIDPGLEAARSFGDYVGRHGEIAERLTSNVERGSVRYCVTGEVGEFVRAARVLVREELAVERVTVN